MKVTTDACLFGAWVAHLIQERTMNLHQVLDMGTGTGLLPLILAQKHPSLQISAIEIDKEAAEQALENVKASPWHHQITVICQDIQTYSPNHSFDLIISNPPFYQDDLRSPDPRKNKAHHDGGIFFPLFLQRLQDLLREGGSYCIMMPYKRKGEVLQLLEGSSLRVNELVNVRPSIHKDFSRIFIAGTKETASSEAHPEKDLTIIQENGTYSKEFIHLLNHYYLYL